MYILNLWFSKKEKSSLVDFNMWERVLRQNRIGWYVNPRTPEPRNCEDVCLLSKLLIEYFVLTDWDINTIYCWPYITWMDNLILSIFVKCLWSKGFISEFIIIQITLTFSYILYLGQWRKCHFPPLKLKHCSTLKYGCLLFYSYSWNSGLHVG